jgi:hypothetical protein
LKKRLAIVALIVLPLGVLVAIAVVPSFCWSHVRTCTEVSYRKYLDRAPDIDIERLGELEEPERSIEFYGMQFVPTEDYEQVRELKIDAVLRDFPIEAGAERWREMLDDADDAGLRVVAVLWEPGWSWNEETGQWDMDPRAVQFLHTVEGHPALLAVYTTHESYWNGCFGCGYTTPQLQQLYRQIKAIADVPTYAALGEIEFWRDFSEETTLANGVCDYCDIWYYPVLEGGTYNRAEYVNRLYRESAAMRELAPDSKLVWVLQAFASQDAGRRLPNADQLLEMAELAAQISPDGIWWYPWTFDETEYQEVLKDNPHLHDVVREAHAAFELEPEVDE